MGRNRSAGFGEMLRDYRLGAGLTQEELAEQARLSTRAISDLERGVKTRPQLATVRQIADALQLSEEEGGELHRAARGRPRLVEAGDRTLTSASALPSDDPAPPAGQHLPIGGFLGSLP